MSIQSAEALIKTLEAAIEESKRPKFQDLEVVREGQKIVMPAGMSHAEAIDWHNRMMRQEEQTINIVENFDAYPLDGAQALVKALKKRFGWVDMGGDFWNGVTMVGVETGFGQTTQVPWGRMSIPGLSGYLTSWMERLDGRFRYSIRGQIKMKDQDLSKQIIEDVKQVLKTDSIYRGKAIRISFPDPDDEFEPMEGMPKFIDLSNVDASSLVFSQGIQNDIQTTLWTPIQRTELCRQVRTPLKRGILLEGPFGVGKTLAANVTAKIANENGWTFIYLENVSQLAQAMHFARMYQPAVIFAEDFDQAQDEYNRSADLNNILNTVDGVGFKDTEIIFVLTTNHVERINQAMLRPGRFDAVISVQPPNAEAVERLIKLYSRGMLYDTAGLLEVGRKLAGQIPATIREVVERSKLAAITRGDTHTITVQDLHIAADGMVRHLELLKVKQPDRRSEIEKAFEKGAQIIADAMVKVSGTEPTSPKTEELPYVSAALDEFIQSR